MGNNLTFVPLNHPDPRSENEQLEDSITLALDSDIQKLCPKTVGDRCNMEKLAINPEFGSESSCLTCKWHLKNAPQFLNCSLLVFCNEKNYQYSTKDIAEMTGSSENKVEGIINSAYRRFIKLFHKRKKDWKSLQDEFEKIPD